MKLTVGSADPIANPSAEQIRSALDALGDSSDSFAILAASELTYIQTSGTPADGFVLEYQTGSTEQHFRSESDSVPLDTVTEAFLLYAEADPSWREVASWQHEDLGGGMPPKYAALLIGAVIALGIAYLVARAA